MNPPKITSPFITKVTWGRIWVDGLGEARDYKLWPAGGRPWDWAETGTHHVPGVQPADVAELLEHGCEAVVLSRGMECRLQVPAETVRHLEDKGVAVHVAETTEAVALYNRLAETVPVGGLFHSTC
ncbi:Mth938-like domain-containing protein [Actinoallomurus soli]|uniref:Mth938-like domain-containing protein n=1 Tax=Actinoallomurus soli TaxID=2952535 RepID=UPI002093B733|nr:MTH938/NDUFAF3 family protein [Actinoallomurus soli]MCO5968810.1 MTH938/NDUFAF3 family protein [Actinoallomurus soli]